MEKYFLLIGSFYFLMAGFLIQFASRGPKSSKIIKKFRIKKDSKLRLIIPFKEKEEEPFVYLKILPLIASIFVFIATIIIYIIYWLSPAILDEFLSSKACLVIPIVLWVLSMVYIGIMNEL